MVVYIEYVIIDNLVIDFLLLKGVCKLMHIKVKKFRIAVSIILGTAFAVLLPILSINSFILELMVKICTGLIMMIILHKYTSFKQFALSIMCFLGLTFVFGGACFMVLYMLKIDIYSKVMLTYTSTFPVGLPAILCYLVFLSINMISREVKKRKIASGFLYEVELFFGENKVNMTAFLDSGNRLYDCKSNTPVIVVTSRVLFSIFSKDEIFDMITGNKKSDVFKKCHYINLTVVGGEEKKMIVFQADKILIYNENDVNIIDSIMVGVSFSPFKDVVKYDMLLHPELVTA